jgi:CheY-like chemotaxis protein
VLLVEDSPDVREVLAELLGLEGYLVETVGDGLTAVERARATRPEVVLVDLGIPGIDGLEVARRIRTELGAAPRLVAVTGHGRAEDRRRAMAAGFDDLVEKPVDLAALGRAMEGTKPR